MGKRAHWPDNKKVPESILAVWMMDTVVTSFRSQPVCENSLCSRLVPKNSCGVIGPKGEVGVAGWFSGTGDRGGGEVGTFAQRVMAYKDI